MPGSPRALLLLAIAVAASGCLWVTKDEGEALKGEVRHLADRVDMLDSQLEEEQQRLTEMIDRAREDVVQLEDTLTRATRVLARNSADFGAEMESAKDRLREVDGALAEIRHSLEEIGGKLDESEKRVDEFALAAGLDLPVDESGVPSKPGEHLEMIEDSLAAGRYGEVRSLAKLFLERHPDHAGADDAQMLLARSYLEQNRWAKALGELRRFTDKYPKSDLTPEVLYEMARAFFSLGDCTDARILIEAIGKRHAKSPFAVKAKELGELMKAQKGRCTS